MHTRLAGRYSYTRFYLAACVLAAIAVASSNSHAADFFNGEKVYQQYCLGCHGVNGHGAIGGAPNFARGQGLMRQDYSLYQIIERGQNAMPAFRGVLKEAEFYDVITYIRSFY